MNNEDLTLPFFVVTGRDGAADALHWEMRTDQFNRFEVAAPGIETFALDGYKSFMDLGKRLNAKAENEQWCKLHTPSIWEDTIAPEPVVFVKTNVLGYFINAEAPEHFFAALKVYTFSNKWYPVII